ncbi:mitochondrial antiviral-signaling protein isoform X3 [Carettochelys insculpta]|uniref:mitochondrial antiviral-signaling protein isoform X3 n=1 Tax=Carettochelys insculpta TaxID=44489 RepID=UPI003EB8BC08
MGFAEDKIYEYIRCNMSDFRSIRVINLLQHLPCLTDGDREKIQAEADRNGNEMGMWQIFYHLKSRSSWVKEFIEALRKEKYHDLAERVQEQYSAHQIQPRNGAPRPAASHSPPGSLSASSPMPPPAADPDPQHTGPTCQNNGHASPLARQAAGLPGSGASPPQAALWREESCQHLGDYNTPVQAVEQLSKQKVTEEAQTPGRKAPSSQPTGNAGLADVRASQDISNSGDGRVPAAIHLSPGSPVGGQLAGERALRREVERAEPDPQSQVHSLAPATHKLHPASRSEPSNIHATSSSSHPTPASHNKVPKPSGTRPATEFSQVSGFSSTTAIPPSSPGLPSDPSGPAFTGDLGELKPPIQETKLPASSAARSTSLPKENANQMPKPLAPTVTRTSTETSGSTAWEEPDEELGLNKPGVLMSTAGREELASGEPDSAETNAPYSGNSKRFICSSSYSLGSNPLMISKSSTASSSIACSRDTQGNQPEENDYSSRSDHIPPALVASSGSGREGVVNTSRASLLPESCSSSWYSTAVETHEVHVVGYPNVDLGEAVAVRDGDCAYENPSPARSGPLRELSGYQRIKNNKARSPSNSETTPGDSPQKVNKPRPGSDGTSFPLKDYVLPAAITAFTSVVALLVYKYLRN